jgi:hypothetical protein
MRSYFYAIGTGDAEHPTVDLRTGVPLVGPFATLADAYEAARSYSVRHHAVTAVVRSPDAPAPRPRPRRTRATPAPDEGELARGGGGEQVPVRG